MKSKDGKTNKNTEDKLLNKVEKYVEKDREKIHKNISQKKYERTNKTEEKTDLELMISRLYENTKVKKKSPKIAKGFLYLVYIVLICISLFILLKYFMNNRPNLS